MVGLKSVKDSNVHVGNLVEEFLESSKIKKGNIAVSMGVSRNTFTQLLQKEEWPDEVIMKFIVSVNELTPNGEMINSLKLFPIAIPAFLEVGKGVVNGLVGRTIKIGLKAIFTEAKKQHEFKDNLVVDGSLGQGNAARSVWIGIRDNRISENGFSEGVYIVLLFDSKGEFAYLSIAFAVSDKEEDKLEAMAKVPATKIMEVIEGDLRYKGIEPGSIDLGDTAGTTAEKYEKSVIVSKKYTVKDIVKEVLEEDLSLLLELFYDFVFEDYFEVFENTSLEDKEGNEEKSSNNKQNKKGKSNSTIDPETYKKLLAAKAEHNNKVGKEAEEFVYNLEIANLKKAGYDNYVHLVKHVSKEKDGLGYDIESIEVDSLGNVKKRYLEVKGSSLGGNNEFTFYLSERELAVAKELKGNYRLVFVEYVGYEKQRIFDEVIPFDEEDEKRIEMKPIMYKCKFKK
ncbi:MrcB family domain-containing protein [Lysinibacillus sp. NPDC093688]|uniref:MrcB family domain-containing protein n=1 Tax=Lysinibacillus sp. NPDC093688 TaxID=3390577 RepID=UPI003D04F658